MAICRACGDYYDNQECEVRGKGIKKHYIHPYCCECHAELAHGQIGKPPKAQGIGMINWHESDKNYHGDNAPHDA